MVSFNSGYTTLRLQVLMIVHVQVSFVYNISPFMPWQTSVASDQGLQCF